MELEKITLADLPKVRKFFDRMIRKDYIAVRDNFFQWQYLDSGKIWGTSEDNGTYMMIEENSVVGVSLACKTPFVMKNTRITGAWHQDWYVLPERLGVGVPLICHQYSHNDIFGAAGQSIDAALVEGSLRNMCWFCLDRLFAAIDIGKTYELLRLKQPKSQNYLKMQKIAKTEPDVQVFRINKFDNEYEQTWEQVRKSYLLTTDRTAQYMNWRYMYHPYFTYDNYKCVTKSGTAYYIWREENISSTDLKVARICDIVGSSKSIKLSFPHIYGIISDHDSIFVDFFCSNSQIIQSLLEAGMRHVITLPDFDLPRLFAPLADDLRKTINFAYYLPGTLEGDMFRHYDTYFTKGDSNQDRPTS